ncbi:prenyltransferase [Halobaculum sp. MBLA0147]|uniref:prenyltransferase n=1 Tax=Halobaculum sp. MBLA0147 TaxID=3079934 RepID=UPI003524A019
MSDTLDRDASDESPDTDRSRATAADGGDGEASVDERPATLAGTLRERSPLVVAVACWRMVRPDQVALICLLYVTGAVVGAVEADLAPASALGGSSWAAAQIVGGGVALLAITATVHYANEYADYETDALSRGSTFSGGSGALHAAGLPRAVARGATLAAGVAVVPAGLVAVALGTPPRALVLLGVLFVGGVQYSLPPAELAWRGLAIPTNALLGAWLLPVTGAATVTTPGSLSLVAFVPFTLVTCLSLLATTWPDRDGDAAVGKRTLATRLAPVTLWRLAVVVVVAYLGSVVVVHRLVGIPTPVLVAHLLAAAPAAVAVRTYTRRESPVPAVAAMVSLAVGLAVAWTWVWVG